MNWKILMKLGSGLVLALALPLATSAQLTIDGFTIAGGGGASMGGVYSVSGSISQLGANQMSGDSFTMDDGFWSIPLTETPASTPITIFDNSAGSENGGFGATAATWLAAKFCLGSQPYLLDSLSLLLSSGNFGGFEQPPSTVRLQIYTHDPVSGKPSASTGLIMNLFGLTNSFAVGPHQWVKWTNATPLRLAANTCYWAVFSVESGPTVGPIASFTKPTGDAGTFGTTTSINAGATWGVPGDVTNFKMLIQGTTVPPEAPTIFDNTGGEENGHYGATATFWPAGKFCLGSQPYLLDSVSLLLSTGGDQPTPTTVRLQIYSNDPVSGKPSVSTGLIMNLSGLTNPITLPGGLGLVKWTPATPFRLAANACYWAVFSRESGGYIGQIASVTRPTGDAGAFGFTSSANAGDTWGAPGNSYNLKMLIRGTASGTPPLLAITAVEKIGGDLKLTFTSVAGQNYAIQSRDGLSSGAWIDFPGAPTSGTGGTIQLTLPNAFVQSQQFYRVKIGP